MKVQTCYGEMDLEIEGARAKLVRSGATALGSTGRLVTPDGAVAESCAGSTPASAPHYRSKLERAYANHLLIQSVAHEITGYWYECLRFRLPGQRNFYKPDFIVQCGDGSIEVREVKGWSKNRREGITKLKTAAGLNPWARFVLVTREKGQWVEQVIA